MDEDDFNLDKYVSRHYDDHDDIASLFDEDTEPLVGDYDDERW